MNIFLDESAPRALMHKLPGHSVQSVSSMGWRGIQNGKLLRLIDAAEFDVFITADKNMSYQQQMTNFSFATLVLSTNDWKIVRTRVDAVQEAISAVRSGSVLHVDCGEFVP